MVEFRMPSLGADMEAGTLVEWLVKPGDKVKRGDVVAVVETQKGAIEIEIFQTGEIEKILVEPDNKVPVGTPLALIRAEAEGAASAPMAPASAPAVAASASASPATQVPPPSAPSAPPPPPKASAQLGAGLAASPAARRFAQQHGIDLSTIRGSGPSGAITLTDVERIESIDFVDKKRAQGLDLEAMRTAIAAAMARSKREIPHYYLQHQIDITAAEDWLAHANERRTPAERLLFAALAVKAVALAARRFPAFNGFYRDQRFEPAQAAHVGVAIAIRGGGLAAPALHDVDRLSLDELMRSMRDLVQRTRAGRMRSSELADATITVSSLGERGVEALYGVIYPPQVAIVGVGRAVLRPWVVDGAIGPRSIVTMTLAADHRVSDGHAGALFLAEVGHLLQEPGKL